MSHIVVTSSRIKNTAGEFVSFAVDQPFDATTGRTGRLSHSEQAAILESAEEALNSGSIGDGGSLYPRIEPDGLGGTVIAIYLSDYVRAGIYARSTYARYVHNEELMFTWDRVKRSC